MIVITLEACPGCDIMKKKHPELPYLQLPRKSSEGAKGIVLEVKKALGKLGINHFPAILSDDLTEHIPMGKFNEMLAKELDLP